MCLVQDSTLDHPALRITLVGDYMYSLFTTHQTRTNRTDDWHNSILTNFGVSYVDVDTSDFVFWGLL